MVKGNKIYLRAMEQGDVPVIQLWENNIRNWFFSETEAPYSASEILALVENASNIRANKQLRLIIVCNDNNEPIGTIDLYDISFKHQHAGIGVLIAAEEQRRKGYANEAISLIMNYAREVLTINNFHCSIQSDNKGSVKLFESLGFRYVGTREKWYKNGKNRTDELLYQKCFW